MTERTSSGAAANTTASGELAAASEARRPLDSAFGRLFVLGYGLLAYLLFGAAMGYFVLFVGGYFVSTTVDEGGRAGSIGVAVLIDLGLILLFGLQHSVMARLRFKRWWTRWVPAPVERSTYVVFSSVCLVVLVIAWRPLPHVLFEVQHPVLVGLATGLFAYGWLLMVWATFMIDHFDLFGLRQVFLHFGRRPYTPIPFQAGSAYRYIRNPMMLGVVIGLWATPKLTVGHLVLAAGFTLYVLVGVVLEERTLRGELGEPYRRYLGQVGRFLPRRR